MALCLSRQAGADVRLAMRWQILSPAMVSTVYILLPDFDHQCRWVIRQARCLYRFSCLPLPVDN